MSGMTCVRGHSIIKEEAYFICYSYSSKEGTKVHDVLWCFKAQTGMCFDVVPEGYGLRFSVVKEPRAELPYTLHEVGVHCLCLKGLVPLSIW